MKFQITSAAIKAALHKTAKISTSIVLFEILNKDFKLTATNGNQAAVIRGEIVDEVKEKTSFQIETNVLGHLLQTIESSATIDFHHHDNLLEVQSGDFKFSLSTKSSETFPELKAIDNDVFSIDSGELIQSFDFVSFASSKQESRPILMGVHVAGDENSLRFEATDSHKLQKYELIHDCKDFEFVVPASALRILKAIIEPGDIKVYLSENMLLFSGERFDLYSNLLEGKYPEISRIFPKEEDLKLVVELDIAALNTTLERTIALVRTDKEHNNGAFFNVQDIGAGNHFSVVAKSAETGEVDDVLYSDNVKGELSEMVCVNIEFLAEFVKIAPKDAKIMKLGFESAFKPISIQYEDETHLNGVLSPIRYGN